MKRDLSVWALMAPAVLLVAAMGIYPLIRTGFLSLYTQNLATSLVPEFCGFANYERVVLDLHFWETVWRTLVFTASAVSCEVVLGLLGALAVHHSTFGRDLARTVSLIPWVLPTAALGLGWIWIFNDQFGVANDLLRRSGVIDAPIPWLGQPTPAFAALVFADVWKTTPFILILLLAGLQTIPRDVYEAAAIDGAGKIQVFFGITLPALRPMIFVAILFRVMQSFGIFDLVYVMTGGGPGGATETVALYTYRTFMRYLDFGYGAALLVIGAAILGTVCTGIWFILGREEKIS